MFSSRDASSFRALQSRLGGTIGVAVSPLGRGQPVERLGALKTGLAWSTSKVPVAMAVIAAGGADRQASDLRRAITASDNGAAERLWSSLGAAKPIAVAVASLPADGRHEIGTRNLTAIARWVAGHVDVGDAPQQARCGAA